METEELEALFNEGRYAELESRARLLVEQSPASGFCWSVLGASLQMQGKEALPAIQKAAELLPDDALAHSNLGDALQALGQLDHAAARYRQALAIQPDFAEVHVNLGNTLRELGRLDEAEASYRRALQIKPEFPEAYFNLGTTLKDIGRLDEAEAAFRRALQIRPDFADAHSNLSAIFRDLDRLEEAEASCRRALQIKPEFAEAHYNLGTILSDLGRLEEAEAAFRGALQINPDLADAHNNLGLTLKNLGRLEEAEASFQRALQIKPEFAEAHGNLAEILVAFGLSDEAAASYRRALQIKPDFAEMHSNLLFHLSHSEAVDAKALFAEHRRFATQFEAPLRPSWPQHANSRNPDRCLQIGFVSGDLRNHAVASFIEPVLAHLAGRPQLSLHGYYNHAGEDSVTERLRGYLEHWHPIVSLSDAALVEKVRADGIDILIDLSGHTGKNRLLGFARKPAPVQASWIGYAGTTGLNAMDYYLADRHFLPPGQFNDQFSEKLVRLPASAPFMPLGDAPPVNALPALGNGYVTFGSFNLPRKLTPSVIALWSQLLRALPSARMVLGAMPKAGENAMLIEWFAREGVARERLSFYPRCETKDYLALHHQVDICLDTFPYPGGTTSCNAMWMGVPTLTLAGSTPVSRVGASVQTQVGLEQFVAFNKSEFVEKGLYWAGRLGELAEIRAGLRVRFGQSAMGQPQVIAAALERALRIMWQRWCAGLPAESFEVPGLGS